MGDRLVTIGMGRKLEGCAPFGRGAGSPCNTMRPGLRPTFVPSGILIHPAVWPQQTWVEIWGKLCPLEGVELGPHLTQCCPGRGLPSYQVVSGPSSRLTTTNTGRKLGALSPFWLGKLGPHFTQCRFGRGLPSYQVAS